MKMTRRALMQRTALAGMALASPMALMAADARQPRPRPTPAQLRWQREELALFVHLGVNTFTGREWGDGRESPEVFDPTALDAGQWARAAKDAGFRSLILTAKHHDGFCLWPTATTAHGVRRSPWRGGQGDVVREFVTACRDHGLGAGLYLSPWDRHSPLYGSGAPYDDLYIAQLTELLSQYGPLVEVWFDGANGEGPQGRRQLYDWPRIHATVRRLQPQAVIFSDSGPDVRWIGNERGEAGDTCWAMVDAARGIQSGDARAWVPRVLQQGDPYGLAWCPGESDVSIRPGWFWHAQEDGDVRGPENLLGLYLHSVGRNSKLLLNVPPTREGLFHPNDVASLAAFGQRRRRLFERDLLRGAAVRASGGEAPQAVLDDDPGRHWQAPRAPAWLEFHLPAPRRFNVLDAQEAIAHGQHIAAHRWEHWQGGRWRPLAWATTIGHRRVQRIEPVQARRLRLVIEHAYAAARLARVGVYLDE